MTLWQWSAAKDAWEWVTESEGDAEARAKLLRGYKRRNPRTARFRWKVGTKPPKRFRARGGAV